MQKWDKPPVDPELRRRIEELVEYKGGGHNPDLVVDIVENALKLLHDVEARGDVRVIQTAVRELRYAFKLFAPHAASRKVTIFGSARTSPTKAEYQHAVEFARKMAAENWMVITGAGPGIMQAGHEGAGPGKQLRREHPSAVGTERQPDHPERQETDHLQIFLHPQTDVRPPFRRVCSVSGRVRHHG